MHAHRARRMRNMRLDSFGKNHRLNKSRPTHGNNIHSERSGAHDWIDGRGRRLEYGSGQTSPAPGLHVYTHVCLPRGGEWPSETAMSTAATRLPTHAAPSPFPFPTTYNTLEVSSSTEMDGGRTGNRPHWALTLRFWVGERRVDERMQTVRLTATPAEAP